MEAYKEAISNTIRLEPQLFYNLLNLCDGLECSVNTGTPKVGGSGVTVDTTTTYAKPTNVPVQPVNHKTQQAYVFTLKEHMEAASVPQCHPKL
jgi:hypothetical protein